MFKHTQVRATKPGARIFCLVQCPTWLTERIKTNLQKKSLIPNDKDLGSSESDTLFHF